MIVVSFKVIDKEKEEERKKALVVE